MTSAVAVDDAASGGARGAWSSRPWRWFLAGLTVSSVGDHLYLVALAVWLLERTGSAGWVSAAVIVRMLPLVILGPIGGVVAGRVDRRRLMVTLDAVRVGTVGAMALVAGFDGSPVVVLALAAVTTSLAAAYRPAAVATTPRLVGEDDLAGANAAESISAQLAWFVGPALGAAIVAAASPEVAFVANAATFGASALLMSRIGRVGGGVEPAEGGLPPDGSSEVNGGVIATARFLAGDRGLTALFWFGNAALFTFGIEQVVYVLVAERRLGMGAAGIGVLVAAIGAGGLVAAPIAARLSRRRTGPALVVSGLTAGVPMVLLTTTSDPVIASLLLAVEGAGAIVFEIVFITLLQRACPESRLAPVYGLLDTAASAALLLGSVAAPLTLAVFGLRTTLWIGGVTVVAATVALAPRLLAMATGVEAESLRLSSDVALLRRFTIFEGVNDAALERLARASHGTHLRAGETLFREGDPPDDLHLVLAGRLSVWSHGELGKKADRVNELGPGDWFGEIGLFRGTPRTATIVAESHCELLTIEGSVFVATLTGLGGPSGALQRSITGRLARTHPTWIGLR